MPRRSFRFHHEVFSVVQDPSAAEVTVEEVLWPGLWFGLWFGVVEQLRAEDPRRIGPYALHARLGAGGMGTVYLGEDSDGAFAAVKLVHGTFADDARFRTRFSLVRSRLRRPSRHRGWPG